MRELNLLISLDGRSVYRLFKIGDKVFANEQNDRTRGVKISKVKTALIIIPSRHGAFIETINFTFIAPLRSISGLAHCCFHRTCNFSSQFELFLGMISSFVGKQIIRARFRIYWKTGDVIHVRPWMLLRRSIIQFQDRKIGKSY